MLAAIFFDVSDAVVLGLGALVGLGTFFFMRYLQSRPVSDAPDCPWYERLFSWGKRHVTWVLAGGFLGLLLFVPQIAQRLTFWAQGAAPISPKQENVDGAQELASRLAGGLRPLGAVLSIVTTGTFYFCCAVALVWAVMYFIMPGLPPWAKRYFTLGFKNAQDEGYVAESSLHLDSQFRFYLQSWRTLLALYAFCLYIAANSQ